MFLAQPEPHLLYICQDGQGVFLGLSCFSWTNSKSFFFYLVTCSLVQNGHSSNKSVNQPQDMWSNREVNVAGR